MSGRLLRRFFESPQTLQFISFRAPADIRNTLVNIFSCNGLNGRSFKAAEAAALAAYRVFSILYADNDLHFDKADTSVTPQTLKSYPTPQSRLDSVMAGILGKERPRSWAFPDDFKN